MNSRPSQGLSFNFRQMVQQQKGITQTFTVENKQHIPCWQTWSVVITRLCTLSSNPHAPALSTRRTQKWFFLRQPVRAQKVMPVWPQNIADARLHPTCLSREEILKNGRCLNFSEYTSLGLSLCKIEPRRTSASRPWFSLCSWTKVERHRKAWYFGS